MAPAHPSGRRNPTSTSTPSTPTPPRTSQPTSTSTSVSWVCTSADIGGLQTEEVSDAAWRTVGALHDERSGQRLRKHCADSKSGRPCVCPLRSPGPSPGSPERSGALPGVPSASGASPAAPPARNVKPLPGSRTFGLTGRGLPLAVRGRPSGSPPRRARNAAIPRGSWSLLRWRRPRRRGCRDRRTCWCPRAVPSRRNCLRLLSSRPG